ncbi:MAG: DsrE/DsrF/TusD sulfur relay family protein [Candidatus Helarchaeota archaeon]
MTTISFLFFSGPYQSEAPETLVKLAKAALDKGIGVKIFCYMDAVNTTHRNQKKVEGIFNIGSGFEELVAGGAEVMLCTLCALVRGIIKNLIDGPKKSGTPTISEMIDESDRFVVIY